LGAYIDGIPVIGHVYAGGSLDWLAPFPMLCGVGVMMSYTLLGCTWLIMKTEGALQKRMVHVARRSVTLVTAAIIAVSIWTPFTHPNVASRWFSFPQILWFAPVPVLVGFSVFMMVRSLKSDTPHAGPFLISLAIIFLGYTGLAISIWPNIVPPTISIWDAASSVRSQGFVLIGTLFIIPFILVYTIWSYYVFRGKVKIGDGYH